MAHHLLGSYQRAFLAILLAQFTRKRFTGGMCGVVRLATSSITVQVPAFSLPLVSSMRHPLCVPLCCCAAFDQLEKQATGLRHPVFCQKACSERYEVLRAGLLQGLCQPL